MTRCNVDHCACQNHDDEPRDGTLTAFDVAMVAKALGTTGNALASTIMGRMADPPTSYRFVRYANGDEIHGYVVDGVETVTERKFNKGTT